jgi:hypothetical protein
MLKQRLCSDTISVLLLHSVIDGLAAVFVSHGLCKLCRSPPATLASTCLWLIPGTQ